jgi:FAD/FMN-containing dehydrogenase
MSQLLPSRTGITGRVLRRGGEAYEHLRKGAVWHAGVPERFPEIIVFAADEDDVAAAIRLAKAEGLQVAVRSGGHSWSGSHLRNDSLLIDLSNLRRLKIDKDAMTATVQPGLRGSELLAELRERDLFFPVGHNYAVGIGGYLLQGGFGWASREYGPACMSVIAFDAATADGDVIRVSETENADLLWAARGAGPGFFAAVTRFTLRVYPHRPVTMSSRYIYPVSVVDEVLQFVHEHGRNTSLELGMLVQRHVIANFEPVVLLGGTAYAQSEDEAREQLALLEGCPVRSSALMAQEYLPTVHGAEELDESTTLPNEDRRWIADNVVVDADADSMLPNLHHLIETLPAAPTYLLIFNWDGHPRSATRPDMAFSLQGGFAYALYTAWDGRADDEYYRKWTTSIMRGWEPQAGYTMLADENLANRPMRFMRDDHFARLDRLRELWDPEQRFVSWLGRPSPQS